MELLVKSYAEQWAACGIEKGDTVLLHSSIAPSILRDKRRLAGQELPKLFFNAFSQAVGEEGTMIYPTFNFDFSDGNPYDIRNSPSQMGALSNYALRQSTFRTGHPVYSFVAFGAKAQQLCGVNNRSAYGIDSPFEMLKALDAKVAILNLPDQNSMTFYHHVEQLMEVPYRFHKDFTQPYTKFDGNTSSQTYSIFVRDIDSSVCTDVNPMGDFLWESGIYSGHRHTEGTGLRVARLQAIFKATANVIRSGKAEGMLFSRNT